MGNGASWDEVQQLELSKKIFELSTIVEVSKEFISTFDAERINSKIVFTLMGMVGAKRGALFSFRPEARRLEVLKAVNFPPGTLPPVPLDLDGPQCGVLQRLSSPSLLSKLSAEYGFIGSLLPASVVANPLVIPLVAENNVLGLILLAEKLNAAYSQEDIATLSSLAGYSALALHRKATVEMLIKSEKMAELGRLGSGIVHEIKNPLTSIVMLSGMLSENKALDAKTHTYLGVIGKEAQRILHLCQNLLSVSRPRKPEMKNLDLNRVVEETLALLAYELKKHRVEVKIDLRPGGAPVLGDEEKLKQVTLNLLINAAHASPSGGTITITTRSGMAAVKVQSGYRSLTLGETSRAKMTVLSVRDEGSGIEPEMLDRIFEPFFTTKAEGQGTGLGLYVTRNIILDHHGLLSVITRPGSGTVFRIALIRPEAGRRKDT